jgi:hypothetical protein
MARVLTLWVLTCSMTWACSCVPMGPACEMAGQASAVFAGVVVEVPAEIVQPNGAPPPLSGDRTYTFEISEPFLGATGRGKQITVLTGSGGGDCGYRFERGRAYLVYAYTTPDGVLRASICSRTAPAEDAEEDLRYLRSLATAAETGYITGMVADGESGFPRTGLAGATVLLNPKNQQKSSVKTTTAADGTFRFADLPAGSYKLSVSKPGYSSTEESREVKLQSRGCAHVLTGLVIDHRITGTIFDSEGLPARDITVQILRFRPEREHELPFPAAESVTDATGAYAFNNVPAGEYYLGINLAQTPTQEMPYGRYFHPGTQDPARAAIVVVKNAGSQTVNLTLPRRQSPVTIKGSVYWPDGRPAKHAVIHVDDTRVPWTPQSASASDAEGRFSVSVFDGTTYTLQAAVVDPDAFKSEPLSMSPKSDLPVKPLTLILTSPGYPQPNFDHEGLKQWRAGRGLR